jgi:hypothetical protein
MKIAEESVIEIDDKILTSSRINLRWHQPGINLRESDTAPEGYLTGDEFEIRCIANISKFYHEKGLL